MFGLFGKKAQAAKTQTTVAPEVGAQLKAESTPPPVIGQAASTFPACALAHFRGDPPAVAWAAQEEPGQTRRAWRLPASAKAPPLAILSSSGADEHVQVWELSGDAQPRFLKQRSIVLDPEQGKDWYAIYPAKVSCLPAGRAAVVVHYKDPRARTRLYIYDAAANSFRSLGAVAPDRSSGPPYVYTETLAAAGDAMLLLYYTDELRLSADNYVPQFNRIVLFSPRHRDGLEVLKLGIDDGNVRGWVMTGKKLWLETEDRRQGGKKFLWSLDLDKVL